MAFVGTTACHLHSCQSTISWTASGLEDSIQRMSLSRLTDVAKQIVPLLLLGMVPNTAQAIYSAWPAAGTCEWPSSVQVRMLPSADHPNMSQTWRICSGVYVGNHIVLTAAHCIAYTDHVQIFFGEHADTPYWGMPVQDCEVHPDGDWLEFTNINGNPYYEYHGKDLAYCKLPAGHPEPPYAPVLVPNGCETDYVRHRLFGPGASPYGDFVTYVSSGCEQDENCLATDPDIVIGTKRKAFGGRVLFETHVKAINSIGINMLQPGQEGGANSSMRAVTNGDSGGPVLYSMPDGSWRVLGINNARSQGNYNLYDGNGQIIRNHVYVNSTPRWLHWIEATSSNDITPCHSWDGLKWSWEGNPLCGQSYDTSPESSSSSWPGCSSSTVAAATECAGWSGPAPGTETAAPSEAELILEFLVNGDGEVSGELLGQLKLRQWIGTVQDDLANISGRVPFEVYVGRGNDVVYGSSRDDEIHGGVGDDLLMAGDGNDIVYPGRGMDYVDGGPGDDKIVIFGTCEIVDGEVIDGGGGYDVLYSPVSVEELLALGVTIRSIEEIVINHPDAQRSACDPLGGLWVTG